MENLEKKTLFIISKKTGKALKCAEGLGGLLGMYALQNTKKGKIAILLDSDNQLLKVYIGSKSGIPEVVYIENEGLYYLENFLKDENRLDINELLSFCDFIK